MVISDISGDASGMTPGQAKRLARKSALLQAEMLQELQGLVQSIERCRESIATLKVQMEEVNTTHKDRKTTAEDIAYLEDLLKCGRKKLDWEKQMASIAKRTPEVLTKVTNVMNDSTNPPSNEVRDMAVKLLTLVQEGMTRLGEAKDT
jgi:chromosome segregation ATPase